MKKIINFRAIPTLLLAMLIGVLIVGLTNFWWWLAAVFAVVALTVFVRFAPKFKKCFSFCVLFSMVFMVASLFTFGEISSYKNLVVERNVVLEGNVSIETASGADGSVVAGGYSDTLILEKLTADGKKIKGKVSIKVSAEVAAQLNVGDRLSTPCCIEKIPLSPKDSRMMSGYIKKIYWQAVADTYQEGLQNYTITKQNPKLSDKIKLFQKENLYNSTDEDTASFLYAMTFGDSAEIPYEIKGSFAKTGTAHLFAVSGLHVGIIGGAIIMLLKKCKLNGYWQCGITMPILIIFCWLCGFAPSACRATLMIFVTLVASAFGRRNDILSSISLAAIILLLIKPLFCFNLSFQLSFFAVYGLIFVGSPLNRIFKKVLPKWLSKGLSASIGANVGLLPLMLIYFNNMSFLFVMANLLIIPLISLAFPIYLLFSLVGAIPHMSFLLTAISFLFKGVTLLIVQIARVDFLKISVVVTWWMVVPNILFMLFVSDYCLIEKKFKTATAITMGGIIVLSCIISMKGVIFPQSEVSCMADEKGNGYITVKTKDEEDYLILTDQTSYDGLWQVSQYYYKNEISSLQGIVLCEEQKETKYLENFLLRVGAKTLYARQPDIRLKNHVQYFEQSRLADGGFSISFLDAKELQIVIDGIKISVLPKDFVSKTQIDCDILFGENTNIYSNIKKYTVDDNIATNSEKFLSWGCLFNIKNGKIRI